MTAADTRPIRPRGAAVEHAVLAAALEFIVANGSVRINIEEIAARAGVNKTTVYRRWPTADELLLATVMAHAETNVPIPDTGSLAADLVALCCDVRDMIRSPTANALLKAARHGHGAALDETRERFWSARFNAAAAIIDRAVERGECAPVDDAELLIEQLVAPIHFRVIERGLVVDNACIERMVARFAATLPLR